MRFAFTELPGERSTLVRPVVPAQVEDLDAAPQRCLVDTGASTNRFGAWLAEAVGLDLSHTPHERVVVGGVTTTAHHTRFGLTIAGFRYDAPVTFCDPWPFAFNLLGQEGFLRYFRVTICARELWLDVEPERRG